MSEKKGHPTPREDDNRVSAERRKDKHLTTASSASDVATQSRSRAQMVFAMVSSFPPLSRVDAKVLIVGSMPGVASLRAQQYYAHPRNAFWPIMAQLFGFSPQADYTQRVAALLAAHVAVWDVLQLCQRPGSADADIDERSAVANDLCGFLQQHTKVKTIACNGALAARWFHRYQRINTLPHLSILSLPSTSPAHAGMPFSEKLRCWSVVRDAVSDTGSD